MLFNAQCIAPSPTLPLRFQLPSVSSKMFRLNASIICITFLLSCALYVPGLAQVQYPEPITIGQLAYPHGHQILACQYQRPFIFRSRFEHKSKGMLTLIRDTYEDDIARCVLESDVSNCSADSRDKLPVQPPLWT